MKTFTAVSVVAAILAATLAWASPLPAQLTGIRTTPPTIESIEPLGIARGVTEELTIEGYNLRGASAIFFSESTVKGRILGIKEMPDVPEPERLGAGGLVSRLELGPQPPRYQVSVEVDIDAEADPGPVRFRFQTPLGTSPAGKFLIEPYYVRRERPFLPPENRRLPDRHVGLSVGDSAGRIGRDISEWIQPGGGEVCRGRQAVVAGRKPRHVPARDRSWRQF